MREGCLDHIYTHNHSLDRGWPELLRGRQRLFLNSAPGNKGRMGDGGEWTREEQLWDGAPSLPLTPFDYLSPSLSPPNPTPLAPLPPSSMHIRLEYDEGEAHTLRVCVSVCWDLWKMEDRHACEVALDTASRLNLCFFFFSFPFSL